MAAGRAPLASIDEYAYIELAQVSGDKCNSADDSEIETDSLNQETCLRLLDKSEVPPFSRPKTADEYLVQSDGFSSNPDKETFETPSKEYGQYSHCSGSGRRVKTLEHAENLECFISDTEDNSVPVFSPGGTAGLQDEQHEEHKVSSSIELFFTKRKRRKFRISREYGISFILKYSLFIFNFLFWVGGIAGVAFGYWILSEKGKIVSDGMYFFLDPAVMCCITGCIVFSVAFFGCLGALRENIFLLRSFQISLIVVLGAEAILGTLIFVYYAMPEVREKLKMGPESVLKNAIMRYHDDDDLKNWIDLIQKEFKCCGVSQTDEGYLDWQLNMYFNCSPANPSVERCAVPVSCCIFEPGDYINMMCGFHTTDKSVTRDDVYNRIFTKGCMKGFGQWLSKNEVYIGGICLGILTPQILGVLFSRSFIKRIRTKRSRWRVLKR